jgi:hypothetical protein
VRSRCQTVAVQVYKFVKSANFETRIIAFLVQGLKPGAFQAMGQLNFQLVHSPTKLSQRLEEKLRVFARPLLSLGVAVQVDPFGKANFETSFSTS